MFGTTVTSEWVVGSPIVWKGEWQGRAYEDRRIILEFVRERVLEYSHFSPLTGMADLPENYHIVTVQLFNDGAQTDVPLRQDNNPTEQARKEAERNWGVMLAGLKHFMEHKRGEEPGGGYKRDDNRRRRRVSVLDTEISFVDVGEGRPESFRMEIDVLTFEAEYIIP